MRMLPSLGVCASDEAPLTMARESKAHSLERMHEEYGKLCVLYPAPRCALDFSSPLELLVATVLSAQTTDVRVNMVTPELFDTYPTAEALAAANPSELEDIIHSTGFYHAKAKHLIGLGAALATRFDSVVPRTMDELTSLPGVGRKTANVVLGNAFKIPGFPVDTHVIRLTRRLRWRQDWKSSHPDPVHIEHEITSYFPPEVWTDLSHRLILHGRAVCHARKPECGRCPLADTCPSAEIIPETQDSPTL